MRYETRWSNGYWKVFDTQLYTTARVCTLKTTALFMTGKMNGVGK